MPTGISLHVGLNRIDSSYYGTDGALSGCENDANAMQRIAASLGYRTHMLLTADARADVILSAIGDAASQLQEGDTFLLTYAGHGAQIADESGDETDQKDETWCVYDRMIIDDEFSALWPAFRPGVLVVMVSDSCHSGTILRGLLLSDSGKAVRFRQLDQQIANLVYAAHRDQYIKVKARAKSRGAITAGVILLSACQDNQVAADGDGDGFFTENLLKTWNNGAFQGSYQAFLTDIAQLMSANTAMLSQRPNYDGVGAASSFESRRPFELSPSTTTQSTPPQTQQVPLTSTQQQKKECLMSLTIDNGNWDEVAQALTLQNVGSRGGVDFLTKVIDANKQAAETAYFGQDAGSTADPTRGNDGARGGSGFGAYWWGFHVQISPYDLQSLLNATDPKGPVVAFLRRILPSDYQRWIDYVAPFVVATGRLLKGLDRGSGVYISMCWWVPGVFVPTSA